MSPRIFMTVSFILLFASSQFTVAQEEGFGFGEGKKTKGKSQIKISKETTHILEPVDADGYIDYVKAINQKLSKGVKPENNAAVAICRVIGPRGGELNGNKAYSDKLFEMLGVEVPPEKGDYFVALRDIANADAAQSDLPKTEGEWMTGYYEQQTEAMEKPWSESDYPAIAKWLAANEKPLEAIAQGVKRTDYYMPLVTTEESTMLIGVLLPVAQTTRSLARALRARAMLNLEKGNPEQAIQDMLTCHRLGLHVAEGAFLVDKLIGIAICGIALDADTIIAESDGLTPAQAIRFRRAIEALPPMPRIVESLDLAERFIFLDSVNHMAKGTHGITGLIGAEGAGADVAKFLSKALVDWNEPMKLANH